MIMIDIILVFICLLSIGAIFVAIYKVEDRSLEGGTGLCITVLSSFLFLGSFIGLFERNRECVESPKPEVQIPTEISESIQEVESINARKAKLLNKTRDYLGKLKVEVERLEKKIEELENDGKPSDETEINITKEWYSNGNLAVKFYHERGNIGYWHRIDGPAYIKWDKNGNEVSRSYWLNNDKYTKEDYLKKLEEM